LRVCDPKPATPAGFFDTFILYTVIKMLLFISMHPYIKKCTDVVSELKKTGLYPEIPIVDGAATETKIHIDGKEYLLFGTNNYLGMSYNSDVKKTMVRAVEKYGLGSGGPRLLAGNIDIHNELESTIADFVGRESAICFTTGYMTNIGTIPALINIPKTTATGIITNFLKKELIGKNEGEVTIVSDEKNHGSIVDGVRLSKTEHLIYKHVDMEDLEKKLKKAKNKIKLIITDGVFSMDGDIAPLPEIVSLAKRYNALIMVDDAHGIGTLGKRGRGSLEHHGIENSDVDILMGTFTKAFGGIGGFVAGDRELISYLKITARTYMLSAPIPPVISAGLKRSIEIIKKETWRKDKAFKNAKYFKSELKKIGYETTKTDTLIVPVLIDGDEHMVIKATNELFKRSIVAPNARFPAVPAGHGRLRVVVTSEHKKDDLDYLLKCLKEIKPLVIE